ncbi:MAG: helix-turn-helix transcriptional regulator [Vicingaceae bacterium]
MDELTKKIAKHIREIRKSKEYSQEYIAAQLNISQQAYQKNESGKTKINLSCALLIAELLEIDFEQLTKTDSSKVEKAIDQPSKNGINNIDQLTNEVMHLRKMNSELVHLLKDRSK